MFVPEWHWVQFVVWLGAYVWMSERLGITDKSPTLWQSVQVDVGETGIWPAGKASALKY